MPTKTRPKKRAKTRPKTPGNRNASVKRIVTEIERALTAVEKSSAIDLKKRRARMLLKSLSGLIHAFCLANVRRMDLSESEFEVPRGKKPAKKKNK